MLKCLTIVGIFSLIYVLKDAAGNMDGGPGVWYVYSIEDCTNEVVKVVVNMTVNKHKMNRTHDVYEGSIDFYDTIGDGYGLLLDICKHSDGGCKQVQMISDESIASFVNKHAKKNMENVLRKAGVDPPEFPISKGTYFVDNFFLNRCELPENAIYGEFTAEGFLMRDGERCSCVRVHCEFRNEEDEECERD